MPPKKQKDRECWNLAMNGMFQELRKCHTCVAIKNDDLGPHQETVQQRCCEYLGMEPGIRPLRKGQKPRRTEPVQHFKPDDFRPKHELERYPKY